MRSAMLEIFITIPQLHQAFRDYGCIRLRDRRFIELRNNTKGRCINFQLFNKSEQNYSTIEKELLAIIYSM